MNYPDDFDDSAFAAVMGETPRALAHETAVERHYDDLLFRITCERANPDQQLTQGQRFIDEMVSEQDLDGALYVAIHAAALHLKGRESTTAEQVGRVLIDALKRDLWAVAERDADAGELR
jgi:hypothetical protein